MITEKDVDDAINYADNAYSSLGMAKVKEVLQFAKEWADTEEIEIEEPHVTVRESDRTYDYRRVLNKGDRILIKRGG